MSQSPHFPLHIETDTDTVPADKKAHCLKRLTDHLFEYALESGEKKIELEEPENCKVRFYNLFSETCSYLLQNGFNVDLYFRMWKENWKIIRKAME